MIALMAFCASLLRTDCLASGPPPIITVQPSNTSVSKNGTATFLVTATSTTALSYQWNYELFFINIPISGATNNTYTISNATYSASLLPYYCSVVNAGGTVNSSYAYLTVTNNPPLANNDNYITSENVAINSGSLTSLTITNPGIPGQSVSSPENQNLQSTLNQAASNAKTVSTTLGILPASGGGVGITSVSNGAILTAGVYNLTGLQLNGGSQLILSGSSNDQFVFNISGALILNNSQVILTNGVSWQNVLFNITSSQTIQVASGFNGAPGATTISGIILAPNSQVQITSGTVTGEIIAGLNITISGGGSVNGGVAGSTNTFGLGLAGPKNWAILQIGNGNISLTNAQSAGYINGNIGITGTGQLGIGGSLPVIGRVYLATTASATGLTGNVSGGTNQLTATTAIYNLPSVLSNDTDINGDPLTAVLVSSVVNGALTFNSNGTFNYTPNTNYIGIDSFTYKANDGSTNSTVATVNITVIPGITINPVGLANLPPVANNDGYSTAENAGNSFASVLANDTDSNEDELTPTLISTVSHGSLTFNSDGTFYYQPNTNYVGSDSFTYLDYDGITNSNIATVTINVTFSSNAYILPMAITGNANSVTANAATLNATINPEGYAATYFFEYGTTTNYGIASTTVSLLANTNTISATSEINGLTPGTLYHFTVVATGPGGTVVGPDMTLNTPLYNTATLTLSTNGPGSISPALSGAALIVGQNYTLTALPAVAGIIFSNWTDINGVSIATSPSMTFQMFSNVSYTANFIDATKPTVSISSPITNIIGSNGVILVTGTAADNVSVSNVYLRLNGSNWFTPNTTNNWSNWSYLFSPFSGTNILSAYAVDSAGNSSQTNTVAFLYTPVSTVAVLLNGYGTISPQLNGAILNLGQNYVLTAIPAIGCVFSNWTDIRGDVITNKATMTFSMASNLVLTANFVDVAKPMLTVTTPITPATVIINTTNASYVLAGKASDNVRIAGVRYNLNNGSWHVATTTNSWTNWSAKLDFAPGTNLAAIYAVDAYGNVSKTNQFTFAYLTVPAGLSGFKVTVTPDAGPGFEFAFTTSTFCLQSRSTNYFYGVGAYTFTRLTANTAKLTINFTAPPLAASIGKQTFLIGFTQPNQARFTNLESGSTGNMLLESVPAYSTTTLANKSVIYISNNGQAASNTYNATSFLSLNLGNQLVTKGVSYNYSLYGQVGALLKQTDANGLTYILATFYGTNYGTTFSESYSPAGILTRMDSGSFGLVSQRTDGNAPTNLANNNLVFSSTGSWFKLSLATNSFAEFSVTDTNDCGVGSYSYVRSTTNSGNVALTFSAPEDLTGSVSSAQLQFFAGNLAYYTNADGTYGSVVLGKGVVLAPTTLGGLVLNTTNYASAGINQFCFNLDNTFSLSGYFNSTGNFTSVSYSGDSMVAQMTFLTGALAGNNATLQLNYVDAVTGRFYLSVFDSNNNLIASSRGTFGRQ